MAASRVFTIPSGVPFLPTLAEAVLSGRLVGEIGGDRSALGDVTLYLPTRRIVRALSAEFARLVGGPSLLPRMIPLGEADEAEFDLAASALLDSASSQLHPPMPPLERRLIMARLVQSWAEAVDRSLLPIDRDVPFLVPSSPANAVALAADLERMMDALTVEGVPWDEIRASVDAEHSRYFDLTVDFLQIAAQAWPGILTERELSDPVERSRALLEAEAERLKRLRPKMPFIIAGSTGSVPVTARLIAAIAGLPRGAVVLPGLDQDLDDEGWRAIDGGDGERHGVAHAHPQAILHRLLGSRGLSLDRREVAVLGEASPEARARAATLSQALRPAETTDLWAGLEPQARDALVSDGLDGIAVIEAADEREEALTIALALRETLEIPGATAALVTPDRPLALRVSAELARWGVIAEDSAGTSLARSPAGRLARLAAELAVAVEPARVIALLSHPFVRLGMSRADLVRGAAALEIGIFRGRAGRPGFAAMRARLRDRGEERHVPRAKSRLAKIDWDLAERIVDALDAAFADFVRRSPTATCNLVATSIDHRRTCERLLACPEDEAEPPDDASLSCLDTLFDDLALVAGEEGLPGRFADYPAFFTAFAQERNVSIAGGAAHPRVRILGLLESRLLAFDRVVVGGLDEGVWPMRTATDAFLNRPMREQIGLNPPERRIGQIAHDFAQALGTRDAVLTRAAKRDGTPTVPSRFLQRLHAFAGPARWQEAVTRGERWRRYAAVLDHGRSSPPARLARPEPKADPDLFPRRLSVTEIETLVRDPYAIFARHVLGLDPLDPVAARPGYAERGTLIHDILGSFAARHPEPIVDPDLARRQLAVLADEKFGWLREEFPELHAEWFPRWERLGDAFLLWERERREGGLQVHAEIQGGWTLDIAGVAIRLAARADRIEIGPIGNCIVDFKTGVPPSNKMVFAGFSPQMTLEAAMLRAGAFKDLHAAEIPELVYVHATGGREPFEPKPIRLPKGDERTLEAIVDEHVARLRGLIGRYLTGDKAYVSRPFPQFMTGYGPYDHLARVLEWSLADSGEGG